MKRRCRRMLWFIRSFLKRMGELRGELQGEADGEAPGEWCAVGSMAQLRDPQHGGDGGGEATLPAGAEQEASGRPSPSSPRKLSIPLPPAPGKLNNCLAPAARTWSGSPPPPPGCASPVCARACGPSLAPCHQPHCCPQGGSCSHKDRSAVPGHTAKRHAEPPAATTYGVAVPRCHWGTRLSLEHPGHVVQTCYSATKGHSQAWSIPDIQRKCAMVPPRDTAEPGASWVQPGHMVWPCHSDTEGHG